MFKRVILCWAGMLAVAIAASGQLKASPSPQSPDSRTSTTEPTPQAFLNQYCVTCHNQRLKTAGLELDLLDPSAAPGEAETWEKVVQKLRTGAMPPAGRPRPAAEAIDAFASTIETEIDEDARVHPNPGRPIVHRLNREEYANAIRDLLSIDIDERSLLPTDESGYGFDNIADVLSVSPSLLSRYMLAAEKISRAAVGTSAPKATTETFRVSPFLVQSERVSDDLPFRSRGGAVIPHYFPLDGEYMVKIRMRRAFNTFGITGLNTREQVDVRINGERVQLFTIGGECLDPKDPDPKCVRPVGIVKQRPYDLTADDHLEARFHARAGPGEIQVGFIERTAAATEGAGPERAPQVGSETGFGRPEMSVDFIQLSGPFNSSGPGDTPSRQRIFVCHPASAAEEEPCATRILETLAHRGYRRPVTEDELQALMSLYRQGRQDATFDKGIQLAVEGMLVSPNFLVRVERDPKGVAPGTPYDVSPLELASRLSFFLWSSIPDDELLAVAENGTLSQPAVLEQQVRRMLVDERAKALPRNFAGQWLHLRDLLAVTPNPMTFPEFDETLREDFLQETELFLESQILEDHPASELLTAHYSFLNERLAKFYGVPHVYGEHFRRVELADDSPRAGVLGQGSILTVTSYATRTSPVVRGKWVLDKILGAPPPPPPPNVPALKETGEAGAAATIRERMEQHRANPVCASCHARMDPLGFALENFNAIGGWRDSDGGKPVDASGKFPDGKAFDGPAEFREALLTHRADYLRTATQNLLTYALGRGTEYYDMPAVRKILSDAARDDYRWSALVMGIVTSTPFRMRAAAGGAESLSAANR